MLSEAEASNLHTANLGIASQKNARNDKVAE